jgi:hypothetical protein
MTALDEVGTTPVSDRRPPVVRTESEDPMVRRGDGRSRGLRGHWKMVKLPGPTDRDFLETRKFVMGRLNEDDIDGIVYELLNYRLARNRFHKISQNCSRTIEVLRKHIRKQATEIDILRTNAVQATTKEKKR